MLLCLFFVSFGCVGGWMLLVVGWVVFFVL